MTRIDDNLSFPPIDKLICQNLPFQFFPFSHFFHLSKPCTSPLFPISLHCSQPRGGLNCKPYLCIFSLVAKLNSKNISFIFQLPSFVSLFCGSFCRICRIFWIISVNCSPICPTLFHLIVSSITHFNRFFCIWDFCFFVICSCFSADLAAQHLSTLGDWVGRSVFCHFNFLEERAIDTSIPVLPPWPP